MHKLITGFAETDHKDHDGLNNQRLNLRDATRSQNHANQQPQIKGSSRFKGVYWHKMGRKWLAQIVIKGHRHYLGLYVLEEDAARAYDQAALEAFGEYACLNPP